MPWLPKPLYQLLPFVYMLCGLYGTFAVSSWYGRVSGIMLIVISLWIWYQRDASVSYLLNRRN